MTFLVDIGSDLSRGYWQVSMDDDSIPFRLLSHPTVNFSGSICRLVFVMLP